MINAKPPFWETFRKTNGALSCAEAAFILQVAELAPQGIYIECGTAYGKSAFAASHVLKDGIFYLVDPLFEDEEVKSKVEKLIINNCKNVYCIADYSTNVIPKYDQYSYAMLDSGDHDQTIIDEFNLIKDRMVSGGVVVLHDLDSQFVRVREVYDMFLVTGNYEEIKPNWEQINAYVDENNIEDGTNQTWHHTELKNPNFIGAVRRK